MKTFKSCLLVMAAALAIGSIAQASAQQSCSDLRQQAAQLSKQCAKTGCQVAMDLPARCMVATSAHIAAIEQPTGLTQSCNKVVKTIGEENKKLASTGSQAIIDIPQKCQNLTATKLLLVSQ